MEKNRENWDKLEDVRAEFTEALEGLKQVHTKEELEAQTLKVNEAKEKLLKVDEDFRHRMEMRKLEAKARADAMKRDMEMKKLQMQTQMQTTRANAQMMRMQAMAGRGGGMSMMKRAMPTLPTQTPDDLMCPICRQGDKGNIIDTEPACFKCMHKLVKRSELKDFNREYRRKWKKKMRKK